MIGVRRAYRWGMGALCACLCTSASAAAQDVCVTPEIERALACDGTASTRAPRRPGSAALPEAPGREAPRAAAPPQPGVDADPIGVLDPHPSRRRELHLLRREREVLERILARTPANDPRRADVLQRLADTLGELIRDGEVRARSLDEPIFQARQRGRAPRVAQLERTQREAEAQAREAREAAVRTLATLVRDHPTYGRGDEALYALAYHLERMEQHDRARQAYQRLIREYSASRFVPHAYLAFAEHAFGEGRLDDARQLYERVLSYPPEHNPVYAYARYKLAWVHFNAERFRESLEELVRVIEHVRQNPDTHDGASLARQARRELVMPYARTGSPSRALAFFRRVGDDEDDAIGMLERLGELYVDTGQWPSAIAVHHQLIAERPRDPSLCEWQARVLDATISSRPKADQVREARRLTAVRTLARTHGHGDDVTRACDQRTATALLLLATAWHREAVGTDDQPGTRDASTMRLAAELYALIESELPELDAIELPSIDQRDRPTRAHVSLFSAELLYEMQRWPECARAYERAMSNPALAADAAYGAVLCYDRHLGTRQPPATPEDRALTARALTDEEEQMARTFRAFACAAPDHEELPIVLYRWARLYYEANQFEQASVLFGRVALQHARSDVSEYAANLYLDSLNVLASRRGRASCHTEIVRVQPELERAFCEDEEARAAHPDLCRVVDEVFCDGGARSAEALGRAGQHREAATRWVALARAPRCEPQRDIYLYNAGLQYEAARLLGRVVRVRVTLVEALPDSPFAARTIYLIGGTYHALAMYEEAATWYERYAREHGAREVECSPEDRSRDLCPDAAEGLQHAVLFRLGLGQRDQALADARLFERLFARRDPVRTAAVVFAIGSIYADAAEWREVASHYREFLRRHASAATPDQLARAHLMIARSHLASGDRARAAPHLSAAVEVHARGGEQAIGGEGEEHDRQVTLLRDAASEALYELAEAERERFEAIPFPTLRGSVSIARVNRWAAEDLDPFMRAKLERFRVAEDAYGRVHALAIPRWRIAAASRVGDMVLGLVDQVRDSPVPDVIARDPELLAAYWEALDEATEELHGIATQRYELCLDTAVMTRWFDDRSRRCEVALNRLDAARYPIASELAGRDGWQTTSGAEPGAPSLDPERDG